MNRTASSRVFLAFALTLTLTFGCVAAAGAQPLDRSGSVHDLSARLLKAAASWLGSLLPAGDSARTPARSTQKVLDGGGVDNSSTMTGTCIDPWGNRIPCPRENPMF